MKKKVASKLKKVYRISVTREDIREGKKNNGGSCPVALACKRQTGFKSVSVDQYYIGFDEGDDCFWFTVPVMAANFITRFDDALPVKPFSFTTRRYSEE